MRNTTKLFVSLVFALGACGDDDTDVASDGGVADAGADVGADAGVAVTLAEVCDETDGLYIKFLTMAFECQEELLEFYFGAPKPTDAELSALCMGALGPFVDDGTAVLGTREEMDACAAHIESLTCETFDFDVPNPCDDAFHGTVGLGDDCDADDQCIGDAFCDSSGGGDCGVCTAAIANGDDCDDNEQCESGYCGDADKKCASLGEIGDDCTTSQDCLGTTVCDPGTDKCASAPTWAVDTPCSTFIFDCGGPGSSLYCHPVTRTCKEWLSLDDPCEPGVTPDDYCNVFEYESCQGSVGSETCTAPTIEDTAGQPCSLFGGIKCEDDLRCDLDREICVTVVPVGGDCSDLAADCGALVDCVDGTCQYGRYTGACPEVP